MFLPVKRQLLLLSTVALVFGNQSCFHAAGGPSRSAVSLENCGPDLTTQEIMRYVEVAFDAMGKDFSVLSTRYRVEIRPKGCDYVFIAVPIAKTTGSQIVIDLDRTGRINTFPWCCPLGHCPDVCWSNEFSAPDPQSGPPEGEIPRLTRQLGKPHPADAYGTRNSTTARK